MPRLKNASEVSCRAVFAKRNTSTGRRACSMGASCAISATAHKASVVPVAFEDIDI